MGAGLIITKAFMSNGEGNLFRQCFKKTGYLLPEVVTDIDMVHPGTEKIAGIKDIRGLHDEIDNRFSGWNRFGAHMIKTLSVLTGQNQLINQGGDLFPVVFRVGEVNIALVFFCYGVHGIFLLMKV